MSYKKVDKKEAASAVSSDRSSCQKVEIAQSSEHMRQSRPDSGLGVHVKFLLKLFLRRLEERIVFFVFGC